MKKLLLFCLLCLFTACGGGGGGGGSEPLTCALRAPTGAEIAISSIDDLLAIPAGATGEYLLMDDISLASIPNWAPIEDFQGKFDGNGCVISDLTINVTNPQADSDFGFFATLTAATIHDLALEDVDIAISGTSADTTFAGAIAGEANGNSITNSYATGKINVDMADNINGIAGGLLGYGKNITVKNSYSTIDIPGNVMTLIAGGIIGNLSVGTVVNSYNAGDLTGNNVGGIAGQAASFEIRNSYSTGTIAGRLISSGILGSAFGVDNNTIKYSYSTSAVTSSFYAGGIAGVNNGYLTLTSVVAINPSVTAPTAGRIAINVAPLPTVTDGLALATMSGSFTPSNAGYGTDKINAALKMQRTYEVIGWKFGNDDDNPWKMPKGGGFPILYWQTDNSVAEVVECGRALKAGEIAISSATDLADISSDPTASYLVMNDISLGSIPNWAPIVGFTGKLDGNCYVISDLTIVGSGYLGLFADIENAEITKLNLADVDISGTGALFSFAGAIAGEAINSTIKHSSATGVISLSNFQYAGGLVGSGNALAVDNSHSAVSVSNAINSGGIVGGMKVSAITNSYNTGSISVRDVYNGIAAGIAGRMDDSTVENSYSAGAVTARYLSADKPVAGGIAGLMSNGAAIINSYSTGEIRSQGQNATAGGIAAIVDESAIQYSYSTASVNGFSIAGGIAGEYVDQVNISNSVAINPKVQGSLVGRIMPTGGATLPMSNNLAEGMMVLSGTADNTALGSGATKTNAELKTQSTYEAIGWKFGNNAANPWQMRGGYPVLYWQ